MTRFCKLNFKNMSTCACPSPPAPCLCYCKGNFWRLRFLLLFETLINSFKKHAYVLAYGYLKLLSQGASQSLSAWFRLLNAHVWQDEDMPIKKWAYDVLIGYVSTPSCPGRKGTHTNYCCALVPERPFVAQTIFSLVRKNVLPQWIWDINAVASYINNFFLQP